MKVKDIMLRSYDKASESSSVREAAAFMKKKDIGSLLVERKGKIVGILTERDIVRKVLLKDEDIDAMSVKEIMSSPLIMVDEDADIVKAAKLMTHYHLKRLAVLGKKNDVVGIVSASIIGEHLEVLMLKSLEK